MSLTHPADLLALPSPPSPTHIVLFIPGNPGLPSYYTPFLTTLSAQIPTAAIFALGHLGHSPAHAPIAFTSRDSASLTEQVEHKVEFVEELVRRYGCGKPGKPKLVLIGHSIGSWICLQVHKARSASISSLSLLFPTVSHMATTPNGLRLSPLFTPTILPPLALTTLFLSFVPSPIINPLIAFLSRQSGPGALVTSGLVTSPGTVLAALSMAKEEMDEIIDLDRNLVQGAAKKSWWYWAEGKGDGWVSESSVQEIGDCLDEVGADKERRFLCEEGMKHAFVLNDEHTKSLAKKCAGWILKDCPMP
ncbi:hypothetical protein P7C70_g2392, partial [Phenoliferia sp. Uapishka_3]